MVEGKVLTLCSHHTFTPRLHAFYSCPNTTGGDVAYLEYWVTEVNAPYRAHHLLYYNHSDTFPTANLICPGCFVQRKEYRTSLDESSLL